MKSFFYFCFLFFVSVYCLFFNWFYVFSQADQLQKAESFDLKTKQTLDAALDAKGNFFDEAKEKAEFRENILKSIECSDGGKLGPDFLKMFRSDADELLKRAGEFVKKSDEANVQPEDFDNYVTNYLIASSSGAHKVVSKEEFCKFCSSGPDIVLLYFNSHSYGEGQPKNLERFLNCQFFDSSDDGGPGVSFFKEPNTYPAYFTKKSGNDTGIDFNVWPGYANYLKVAFDFSKTKIIDSSYLDKVLKTLFYDRPELLGKDNLKYFDFSNSFVISDVLTLKHELYDEALKKTFGYGYDECFKRLNSNFYNLSGDEKLKAVSDFKWFILDLSKRHRPFSQELEKLFETCKQKNYFKNKLIAVLSNKVLCAKLLDYQAIGNFSDGSCKNLSRCRFFDPGCVVVCAECLQFDENISLGELFCKVISGFKEG